MKTLSKVNLNWEGYMMYRDKDGNYYADINYKPGVKPTELWLMAPPDDIDGEPCSMVKNFTVENPETDKEIREANFRYEYMILGRLKSDCDGFLSEGDCRYRNPEKIWGNTIESHIKHMKEIWMKFDDDLKPEWCSWEQILEYERKMSNQ